MNEVVVCMTVETRRDEKKKRLAWFGKNGYGKTPRKGLLRANQTSESTT